MTIRCRAGLLLLGCLLTFSACGEDGQNKLNRIRFLYARQKDPAAAIKFVKESYGTEKGDLRGQILMEGASIAFQQYLDTLNKSQLREMFLLLEIVINEKLPQTPDAYLMCSQAYDKLGEFEKALEYARHAVKSAPEGQGGKYQFEVMGLFVAKNEHRDVIREADRLMQRFPNFPEMDRVRAAKKSAELILEELRRSGGS